MLKTVKKNWINNDKKYFLDDRVLWEEKYSFC
jgi:hypothetical protein